MTTGNGGDNRNDPRLLFQHAVSLHQSGRLDEAERLYRELLSRAPSHPAPLHFLGIIEQQRGRFAEAVALMDKSVAVHPSDPAVHYNRANALRDLNRKDEALASFDRALALKPDHAQALNNRGTLLHEMGRLPEALDSYGRALAIDPNNADAHSNRAYVLNEMKRPQEALGSCDRALALAPDHPGAYNNRGNALRDLGRPEEAVAAYERSLAIRPNNPDVWVNRGNALKDLRRYPQSLASYRRALELQPRHLDATSNCGFLFAELNDWRGAEKSFAAALSIRPNHPHALYGYGQTLLELKRHDEAIVTYETLVKADPDYPYGLGMLLHAKRTACDWAGLPDVERRVLAAIHGGRRAVTPYAFLYGSDSPADNLVCAQLLAKDETRGVDGPLWRGERYGHEKIRVAYLSADFRSHAVASLIAGVFEAHDRNAFETIAISYGADDGSAMRARLKAPFDRFIDVLDMSNREAAARIRESEADIAVDLTGYTGGGRSDILARRPAPVQVNYLGYPGTMGAPYYDYILADAVVIPQKDRPHYSENVVELPFCYMPMDMKRRVGAKPSRKEAGLPEAGFVFCSFNNSYKLTPHIFDIWMRLLRQVDGSVLWLSSANPAAMRHLLGEAQARGVAPERLVFAPHVPAAEDHLARIGLADLFLDTLPCNAHTTANDALFAGLPILTMSGHSFAGRVAASLLAAARLPEMIAETAEAYESAALDFARSPEKIRAIRERLERHRQSAPLFDTGAFTRSLERAYRQMWERAQRLEAPAPFAVRF